MTSMPRVHGIVLAGGAGTRLHPLTLGRCKPAMPFAGNHCVVDFVLGNLWNSGVRCVDLLVQHEPRALVEHVRRTWGRPSAGDAGAFVRIAPPRAGSGYLGTADAVRRNLGRIDAGRDIVAVFGADHVYRMDVRHMVAFHVAHRADVTIAALPVPLAQAGGFGIVQTTAAGRIVAFDEKPRVPTPMPGRPDVALASMGNYLFDAAVLRRALAEAAARGETDFGQHVLPRLLARQRVMAYDFGTNVVPGASAASAPAYWRDVGTIDAYFDAHLDTLGPAPTFAIDNAAWPMRPRHVPAGPPPRLAGAAMLSTSCIADGAVVGQALVERSVIGRGARVHDGATLARCVVLDGAVVGAGARLDGVIVDRDNVIPPNEVIGIDPYHDRSRFPVSAGGVVVVPRGTFRAGPGPVVAPAFAVPTVAAAARADRSRAALLHG